ncbi:hypothetical protein CTI12_AA075910 [Artemisia annua]|uniref:Myb/SANT-like domain-containing protein n=1 Tax=Artemisia annua TaxID=35608 RepID=A0A2U1Q4Z3_ARTAN|nr:hypothetical protein CTI12_AA075910 [Artemisia annua]
MAIDHIDTTYSKLSQAEVDEFCKKYNIPGHLLPEAPGPFVSIKDAPAGKIGVYTRFFELGLSQTWDDDTSRPTFLWSDEQEMDLFAFINQPDLFKVKTGERTLKEYEPTLLAETANRVVEPTENVVSLVHHTVVQEIAAAKAEKKAGKKRVTISAPSKPNKKKRISPLSAKEAGAGSGAASTEITLTHKELQDESGKGLERSGPHTDANIMKNMTVLSSDSAASAHHNLESENPENPASASTGSTHAPVSALAGSVPPNSVSLHVESSSPGHTEEVTGHVDAAVESEAESDDFYQSLSVDTTQATSAMFRSGLPPTGMGRLMIKKHRWTRIEDEASPHIESRLKTLKKYCDAITDMKDASGIEWRATDRTLICYDDDVWEDWVKDHSDAKVLRNKPFPYYNELCLPFGKNRGQNKNDIDSPDNNRPLEMYEISDSKGNENNESDHEKANSHYKE